MKSSRFSGGYTLLELCIVLSIVFLFFALATPALQSALAERSLRQDANQFSLLVKTAMTECADEKQPYQLTFSARTISLSGEAKDPEPITVTTSAQILVPSSDPQHPWNAAQEQTWFFQPGELCPAQTVRFAQGSGWIELSFNLLTGEVETERSYLP